MGEWTVCSPGSTVGAAVEFSLAAEACTGTAAEAEISGTATGAV